MIRGKEPTNEFVNHPEGRFSGIVYAWKFMGDKTDQWGNEKKRAMLRIESSDCIIGESDTENEELLGLPFTAAIFHSISFGNHTSRKGTYVPMMQKIREVITDHTLTDDEWYNFDPWELMDVRVRYRVTHTPKDDGNGVWVNCEILERQDDQTIGDRVNEIDIKEPPEEEAPESQRSGSAPSKPKDRGRKPPLPGTMKPSIDQRKIDYAKEVVRLCVDNNLYTEENATDINGWLDEHDLSVREFEDWYGPAEAMMKEKGIALPTAEVHPLSQSYDDLPF